MSARQCDNCKTDAAADADFCPKCGQRFEPPGVPPAPPPAPPPPAMPVPPPVIAQPPPARGRSPWPAILIGCGLLLLIVIGVGAYVGYRALQRARTTWEEMEAEMKTPPPSASTPSAGEAGDGTAASLPPMIEVSEDPVKDPPTAYPVEDVPPVEVQEGVELGPVSNGDQAAGLVVAMPDVAAWAAEVKAARESGKQRRALLTVELIPGTGNYLVHVFESVEDDEPGHIATFGWFKVDKSNGVVSNENPP